MRRLARGLVVAASLGAPAGALAEPARVSARFEAGAEVDTNPHRLELPDGASAPEPAAAARVGGRMAAAMRPTDNAEVGLSMLAAAKRFGDLGDSTDAAEENVLVLAADLRGDMALPHRSVLLGARLRYYEAFEDDTVDESGHSLDRDFRTAEGMLTVGLVGDGQRLQASAGYRTYAYKPDRAFDFDGEVLSLGLTRIFHPRGQDDDAPALALTVEVTANRRRFDTPTLVTVCDEPEARCIRAGGSDRVDLFQSGAVELAWRDTPLVSARYELHRNDSTSHGSSLWRHRLELSATSELFAELYLTGALVVQREVLDDPILLPLDGTPDAGTFLTIEDENRNSLALHLTRDLSPSWTAEARWEYYSNALSSSPLGYDRQVAMLGLVYSLEAE